MTWRLPSAQYKKQRGEANRRELQAMTVRGEPTGVLAYHGAKPVGWISVAPREQFAYLARAHTLRPPDDQPVWSVTCFLIDKEHRRQGLSEKLLKAAESFVRSRGGRILEGYPTVPRSVDLPAVFAWTGLPSTFEKAGYVHYETPSRSRLLMRKSLR